MILAQNCTVSCGEEEEIEKRHVKLYLKVKTNLGTLEKFKFGQEVSLFRTHFLIEILIL